MIAARVLELARERVDVRRLRSQTRLPFRIFLGGDPALLSQFRGLLLAGHGLDYVPRESAATLETIDVHRPAAIDTDARAILHFSRPGDVSAAELAALAATRLPVLSITVDPAATPRVPPLAPAGGMVGEYVVPSLERDALRLRVFPHLVDACKGVEIAVGRHLPALREAVGIKLTRIAARQSLQIATASAIVDHVPILGLVLGPVASAGDMVAITGIQLNLLLQISAAYGKEPDLQRVWEMLPIVGGGFGWRALSRELAGFLPVAGIAVKGAIAYAGTIVVGEGIVFFYEFGRHMTKREANARYDETKRAALTTARELARRLLNSTK